MSRRGNRHARWRRIAAAVAVLVIAGASSACSTRSDEWGDSQYAIAGGGSNGVYYAYGAEVARALSGRWASAWRWQRPPGRSTTFFG